MIEIDIFENDQYISWWQNFDDHHHPIWDMKLTEQKLERSSKRWEIYVNEVLKDIAIYNYWSDTLKFYNEEDVIRFLLEWS